jgi:hypothetical protein
MTVILLIIKFSQQNWQQNNLKQKNSPLHKALDMTLTPTAVLILWPTIQAQILHGLF